LTPWKLVRLLGTVLSGTLAMMPLHAATPDGAAPGRASADQVEILTGSDPACNSLRDELAGHWQSHGFDGEPTWKDTDRVFPRELGDAAETDLDFYNDGQLARIFITYYDSPYMKGSSLLVQPGRSPEKVDVASDDPLEDPESWFIPCQLQGKRFALQECPPFSRSNEDAGLTVLWANRARQVRFLARYTDLALIRLRGTTFVVVTGSSPAALGYAAVLKPLATRTFRTTCLLQRR
jgi:hypothetical protein